MEAYRPVAGFAASAAATACGAIRPRTTMLTSIRGASRTQLRPSTSSGKETLGQPPTAILPKDVSFTPVIRRRPGDCSMHDSPSLQIEKEQNEDRAEEHVEGLHEVTSPGNVVAEESTPAVAVAGYPLLHVPLHGALRDPDSKLEQLTSKPLGAPPWVSRRHVADQRRVACRPSATSS